MAPPDCLDCGRCPACVERSRAYAESHSPDRPYYVRRPGDEDAECWQRVVEWDAARAAEVGAESFNDQRSCHEDRDVEVLEAGRWVRYSVEVREVRMFEYHATKHDGGKP